MIHPKINNIIADLIGEPLQKIKARGNYSLNNELLQSPLTETDSVIRFFCHACGLCVELNQEALDELVNIYKLNKPADLTGLFLEASSCEFCSQAYVNLKFSSL